MIARGLAVAVALSAAAACTVERQVLGGDDPLASCTDVWARGAPGDSCTFSDPCSRETPEQPMCCLDYAYCRSGALVMDTTCNPDCATCVDDHSCAFGAAICNGTVCEPCPPSDPTGQTCQVSCPPNWGFLSRNGCGTCECAPRSECSLTDPTTCAADPNGERCYAGFPNPLGCAPDDDGCQVNVCSAPGCSEPAPLGCFTTCTLPACTQCATTACDCDPATGTWRCEQVCVDDAPVNLPCFM